MQYNSRTFQDSVPIGFNMSVHCLNNNIEMQRPVSSTQNNVICRNMKKSRRFRSAFSTEQVQYLENEFKKCPYIGNTSRQELANILNISERAIKIWFQNRRMKEKKDNREVNTVTHNKIITVNLTNDQFNNVNNLQSANDEVRITTSLKIPNEDSNVNQEIVNDCKTNPSGRKHVFQSIINDAIEHEITTTTSEQRSPNISNRYEKYQQVCQVNENLNHKIGTANVNNAFEGYQRTRHASEFSSNIKTDKTRMRPIEVSSVNEDRFPQNKNINESSYSHAQELPQDLSQRKDITPNEINLKADCFVREAVSTPIYIQNCFTPPCIPGNVVWKPVNMSSVLPGVAPIPGTYAVLNPQNLRKSNCNCDCHLQFSSQVLQDQNPAQYIPLFTLPYSPNMYNK